VCEDNLVFNRRLHVMVALAIAKVDPRLVEAVKKAFG